MSNPTDNPSGSASSIKKLKDLITMRSSIKGQITKFNNYLNTASACEVLTHVELAELGLKLSRLETLSVRFDELQSQIEVLSSANLSEEIDERESFKKKSL